jgi:hypothetical protein
VSAPDPPRVLERRSVSRKTPGDGRLEISEAAARRLSRLGTDFPLSSGGRSGRASVEEMACTCGKEGHGPHLHHFLSSPLLRTLEPGTEVWLELDPDGSGVLVRPD